MLGSASVTMLASSCPMNAPMQTVPTTYQCARGLFRTAIGLRGSRRSRRPTDPNESCGSSTRTHPFQRVSINRSKTYF